MRRSLNPPTRTLNVVRTVQIFLTEVNRDNVVRERGREREYMRRRREETEEAMSTILSNLKPRVDRKNWVLLV